MSIPKILYKTGPHKNITDRDVLACFSNNEKRLNCKLAYFNNSMCRKFLIQHFHPLCIKAFDMLIPGAYKADLWRLCILYIFGGVYSDLTQTFLEDFDINKAGADLAFILDRPVVVQALNNIGRYDDTSFGIYNAFICAKPKNTFILYCINCITHQIINMGYGKNPLDVSGPIALARHFTSFFGKNLEFGCHEYTGRDNKKYKIDVPFKMDAGGQHCVDKNNTKIINNRHPAHYKKVYISKKNKELFKDIGMPKDHYSTLWAHRAIYKTEYMAIVKHLTGRQNLKTGKQKLKLGNFRFR